MSPSSSQLTNVPAQSTRVRVPQVLGKPDRYLPPNTLENPQNRPHVRESTVCISPLLVILVAYRWRVGWLVPVKAKRSTCGTEGEGSDE